MATFRPRRPFPCPPSPVHSSIQKCHVRKPLKRSFLIHIRVKKINFRVESEGGDEEGAYVPPCVRKEGRTALKLERTTLQRVKAALKGSARPTLNLRA